MNVPRNGRPAEALLSRGEDGANDPRRVYVAIPCRSLNDGKSRLAGRLEASSRRSLVSRMLGSVLRAARLARIPQWTSVVTGSEEVAALARRSGVDVLWLEDDRSLICACETAAEAAARLGAGVLMIVPGDLPLVTSADIDAAIRRHGAGTFLTIAKAVRDGGTNLLVISPPEFLKFRFGEGSFQRHVSEATTAGASISILDDTPFTFDIDTPEDLDEFTQRWGALAPIDE